MKIQREHMLLYAVTDGRRSEGQNLTQKVEIAVKAGVTLVQYRNKELAKDELVAEARRVHEITRRYGVPLIINDDVEVAYEVKAEGIHLGQEDAAIDYARSRLGCDIIIGVTAHSVEEAMTAQAAGADYIGAGALFGSTTKDNTIPMSLETLTAICKAVTIPVVAIGGITEENIMNLSGSGIVGVAVVSAIFGSRNIYESVKSLSYLAKSIINQ